MAVPDLDLVVPPPKRGPTAQGRPASAPPSKQPKGPLDDSFEMGEMGGSLDLAPTSVTEPKVQREAERPHAPASIMQSEDGGRAAAEKLGSYGDPPEGLFGAPFYAYRVKSRQRELRRALAEKREALEKAQVATTDALVHLADRARASILTNEAYAKLLGAVIVAENSLRNKDSVLAAATDAHKKETAGLDQRLTHFEAVLAGARAEERSYNNTFERVDAVRQRAEAKLKRIEIDLRNAAARGAADVADRTEERATRQRELEQAMPEVTEALSHLNAARRKVADVEGQLNVVRNELAKLEAAFKKKGKAHSLEVVKAQKEVREALAALGRAVVKDTATFGAEWAEARGQITALDRATASRDDEVMVHVMALDVFDRDTVQKGMGVAGAALALVFLLLTVPFLVRALTSSPPPPPPPPTETGE
jgi:hypothetical protein